MSRAAASARSAPASSCRVRANITAARKDPAFGRPEVFCSSIPETKWESATVTTLDERIPEHIRRICGRDPLSGRTVTGGIVTERDSSWLLSWTVNRQPQFKAQDPGQVVVKRHRPRRGVVVIVTVAELVHVELHDGVLDVPELDPVDVERGDWSVQCHLELDPSGEGPDADDPALQVVVDRWPEAISLVEQPGSPTLSVEARHARHPARHQPPRRSRWTSHP